MDPKSRSASSRLNAPISLRIPSSRPRRIALLGSVAVAAGAIAAGTMLMVDGRSGAPAQKMVSRPLRGQPPLILRLGANPPAGSLDGKLEVVEHALSRPGTPTQALLHTLRQSGGGDLRVAVALAMARYSRGDPQATLRALERLPRRPMVLFHVGLTQFWAGHVQAAIADWRATRRLDRYGFYGTRADNLLHPETVPGYPVYVAAPGLRASSAARARSALRRHPRRASDWLRLAVALESRDRGAAIAAARHALALDPTGIAPRVAYAVLSFDKDNPARSVGTLGTMAAASPDNSDIRFHFALLLLWLRRSDDAVAQFRQLVAADPSGVYAHAAHEFIDRLG